MTGRETGRRPTNPPLQEHENNKPDKISAANALPHCPAFNYKARPNSFSAAC